MATSGSITGTAKNSSGAVNTYYNFVANWNVNSRNVDNNTSNITVSLQINYTYSSGGAYNLDKKPSVSLSVNGVSRSATISYIDVTNYKTCTFATWTGDVTHKDDGSLNCPIVASFTHYGSTTLGSGSVSGTANLNTIPKASTIDSLSCNTSYFDGTITYKYTPKSSSYYNRCYIYLNINDQLTSVKSINLGTGKSSQQSPTVTLSTTELETIYNGLPSSTKGKLRFIIRTYSDSGYSKQVGGDDYKDIELTIPTTVKPSLGEVSLSTSDGSGSLLQDKNTITVSIGTCTAGAGSSIKSYTFTVLSGNTTIDSKTTTRTSATFGPFSQTGTLKFRVTVTDNRSRTESNSGSEPTMSCFAYNAPKFSSFKAYRCDSNGNATGSGTYIKYDFAIQDLATDGGNTYTVKLYYKNSTSGSWTSAKNALENITSTSATDAAIIKNTNNSNVSFTVTTTYLVRAEIVDSYGATIKSPNITVFGESRILNIRETGNGIAFGKLAEYDNMFECKWPATFNDSVTVPGGGDPVINGYSVGTLGRGVAIQSNTNLNSYTTPGVFYSDSSSISGSLSSVPDTSAVKQAGFRLIVECVGSTSHIKQTIIPRSTGCHIYQRYKHGSNDWGAWTVSLTDGNISSYINSSYINDQISGTYLPIDGGTLTGPLTLPETKKYTGSNFGIDMNASDIINLNGLWFKSTADTSGEGFNFYRSDGVWDTLYAAKGELKFYPNRGTTTGFSKASTVYHNGSFQIETGTITLNSTSAVTHNFDTNTKFGGVPNVVLTAIATAEQTGVITAKVRSVNASSFTAIIGGSATGSIPFAFIAIYGNAV